MGEKKKWSENAPEGNLDNLFLTNTLKFKPFFVKIVWYHLYSWLCSLRQPFEALMYLASHHAVSLAI